MAIIHAALGGHLVLVARSSNRLLALKSDLESAHKVKVYTIEKDLSQPNAAKEIYDEVKSEGLVIDYLINNAGFGGLGKFNERELNQEISMINLNVLALTTLTHYFLQDFVMKNEGRVLNVSSTASLLPGPLQAVYYATKAYVTSFTNALAEELHDKSISITNLMPGPTDTKFGKVSGMDKTDMFKNTATARSVAEEGYNGMLEGKLNVISGLSVSQKVMLTFLPFAPKKVVLKQVRKMQEVNE
jgi:short-subunit dehydrogenase